VIAFPNACEATGVLGTEASRATIEARYILFIRYYLRVVIQCVKPFGIYLIIVELTARTRDAGFWSSHEVYVEVLREFHETGFRLSMYDNSTISPIDSVGNHLQF